MNATVIHLNAAGAAMPLPAAHAAMRAHLDEEARVGPHWAAAAAHADLATARACCARVLGARDARHVAFGETATRLWALAFGALPLAAGARILVGRGEWGGNVINALKRARDTGAVVEVIPVDASGRCDVAALAAMLDDRVAAIAVPIISSGLGTVQPVAEIGRLARPRSCLLFVDAAQAVGRLPVSLTALAADVLVAPSRKWLRGPRGQAMLALSPSALALLGEPPLLDQAGAPWVAEREWRSAPDAGRFESYEYSVASRLGLGAALTVAESDLATTAARIDAHVQTLRVGLAAIPGCTVAEPAQDAAGFLTFSLAGEAPSETVRRLQAAGIAIACVGIGNARLEFMARGITETARVSPHACTTEADLERFLEVLRGSA